MITDPEVQAKIEEAKFAKKTLLQTQERVKKLKEARDKKIDQVVHSDPRVTPLENGIQRLEQLKANPLGNDHGQEDVQR